jgi:hypothetical protein
VVVEDTTVVVVVVGGSVVVVVDGAVVEVEPDGGLTVATADEGPTGSELSEGLTLGDPVTASGEADNAAPRDRPVGVDPPATTGDRDDNARAAAALFLVGLGR